MPPTGAPTPEQTAEAVRHASTVPQSFDGFINGVWQVWYDGGWVMIPLFFLAIFIYFEATALILQLRKTGVKKVTRRTWTSWIDDPSKGNGHVGEVIRYVLAEGMNRDAIITRIAAVRRNLIPSVNQKIVLLSVLVTVAPLMGLLGTVIGMLTTFKGLAVNTGQTIDLVASGISVALITTETGLMIAIPGYIFISQVIRKRNDYNGFLTQLESTLVQRTPSDSASAASA